MDNNERILFETYFQITGYKGKEIDISYLQLIINILLNSKEFENKELLTLSVQTNKESNNFSYYATYYDIKTKENRDMTGIITIKNNKIYLRANIYDYTREEELEIGELFEETNHNISRFTTYSNSNKFSRTNIKKEDFNKAENFIEETTKLIKQKRRG